MYLLIQQLYEQKLVTTPLALAEVIHASFLKELVLSLPDRSDVKDK